MNTVALLLSLSEQPIPRMQARKTVSASSHLGEFLTAQADGQHSFLTSLLKHMGSASWLKNATSSSSGSMTTNCISREQLPQEP